MPRGLLPYMPGGNVMNGLPGRSALLWLLVPAADFIKPHGDVPAQNLPRPMRCGLCGAHLSVNVAVPDAEERQRSGYGGSIRFGG
jgi:hypothetical protein